MKKIIFIFILSVASLCAEEPTYVNLYFDNLLVKQRATNSLWAYTIYNTEEKTLAIEWLKPNQNFFEISISKGEKSLRYIYLYTPDDKGRVTNLEAVRIIGLMEEFGNRVVLVTDTDDSFTHFETEDELVYVTLNSDDTISTKGYSYFAEFTNIRIRIANKEINSFYESVVSGEETTLSKALGKELLARVIFDFKTRSFEDRWDKTVGKHFDRYFDYLFNN